jgi:hypothetical protein
MNRRRKKNIQIIIQLRSTIDDPDILEKSPKGPPHSNFVFLPGNMPKISNILAYHNRRHDVFYHALSVFF